MIFDKKIIQLKDDRECILRPVEVKDAEAMIEYLRMVSSETPFLLRNEDEVTYTVEAEEQLLEMPKEFETVVIPENTWAVFLRL